MGYFEFTTTGPLEALQIGEPPGKVLIYRVLFLDAALEARLFEGDEFADRRAGGRLRIEGEIEDRAVSLAWQSSPRRGHYVMISPALCKALQLEVGAELTLRFNVVAPDTVAIPEELADALRASPRYRKLWAGITPGQQRGIVATIVSAKTAPTRKKRIEAAFASLAEGGSPGRPPRRVK